MKKKSGFIFVETIIVIAVLTTALLLLYSTFTGILNQEKRRAAYDDIAYIYRTYYLMEFYGDVAQRNLSLGIDEKNYMVSIPLVASNATDLIPEEEKSFYEQLMASTFSATNVYFANGDLSKYEACSEEGSSEVSCDILNDLAGNGWKGYFKTLGDTTENAYIIAEYGVNKNGKGGNQCFRIGNDEVTADETECKFYYASIKLDTTLKTPDLHCGTTDLVTGEGPVLNNGLIPVVYENNKWVKADTTKKWYDYCEQWWANAVTVKEGVRTTYQNASAGTEIPMSAINTMWVWIPRYEYRTDNLTLDKGTRFQYQYAGGTQSQPGAINVNFVSQDTTTASASNFLIHPAFTFGTQELSGIWVAKFEMSPAPGTTCATTPNGRNCDITTFAPEIKPNVSSWRYTRIGTFFTTIQSQMNGITGATTYGITNSDTHMIKNMEWGAVAYLSQSKYGKYGNASYEGRLKKISVNNCSKYITGVGTNAPDSSTSVDTCITNTYETAKGQAASTTGNIYGIYDMVGGAADVVMGVIKAYGTDEPAIGYNYLNYSGFSGKFVNGGSDFDGTYGYLRDYDDKYYDLYSYRSQGNCNSTICSSGKIGDATVETLQWYDGYYGFPGGNYPWVSRGGNYQNVGETIFNVFESFGSTYRLESSRPVLVSST